MTRNDFVTQQAERADDTGADEAAGNGVFDRGQAFLIAQKREQCLFREHGKQPLFFNLD